MTLDTGIPTPPDEDLTRPPVHAVSIPDWIRANLFRTWYDTIVTVVVGSLAAWTLLTVVRFVLTADYTILRANLALFMVGRFPRDQMWRPAVSVVLLAVIIGFVAGVLQASARARSVEAGVPFRPSRPLDVLRRFWPILGVIALVLALSSTWGPTLTVIAAFGAGIGTFMAARHTPAWLRRLSWLVLVVLTASIYLVLTGGGVDWNGWGGLQLTLFLTIAGIALAFPIGLLLALGRRSSLPAVRYLSVTYIELVRGVPLITLLLMGIFVIGFFLPEALRPGPIIRVLIAITLFESAYIAEVVRGGLQAVPKGQIEASQALGMSPWKTMRLIVLPQALRATIPAMVGQFISLFKDTTLVSLVGLLDLLEVSSVANNQPDFLAQGFETVTLGFVALVFWVGSYVMSREARRLETKLGVGER